MEEIIWIGIITGMIILGAIIGRLLGKSANARDDRHLRASFANGPFDDTEIQIYSWLSNKPNMGYTEEQFKNHK